jgi:hypothetical protein
MWCSHCPVIDIDRVHGKDAGKGEKMLNGTACGVHVAPLLISTMRMEKMLEGVKQGGMWHSHHPVINIDHAHGVKWGSVWCSHHPVIDIDRAHGKDAGGGQTGQHVVFTLPRY